MQNYWKEAILTLPRREEFTYIIKNKNTNCVIIRNSNIRTVKASVKPQTHEVIIPPNSLKIISRPFPLSYVYLSSERETSITIIETICANPVNAFLRQEAIRINSHIINKPQKICQKIALFDTHFYINIVSHDQFFFFNTDVYAYPVINIYLRSSVDNSVTIDFLNTPAFYARRFTIDILKDKWTNLNFNDNAFRYIEIMFSKTAMYNQVVISSKR